MYGSVDQTEALVHLSELEILRHGAGASGYNLNASLA